MTIKNPGAITAPGSKQPTESPGVQARRRRRAAQTPVRPRPNRAIVEGSGAAPDPEKVVVAVKKTKLCVLPDVSVLKENSPTVDAGLVTQAPLFALFKSVITWEIVAADATSEKVPLVSVVLLVAV